MNNYVQPDYQFLLEQPTKYTIIGKEVGAEGTPHLQGYMVFASNKRLAGVKKLSPRAHWEAAKGTTEENFSYCSKEGNFEERGVRPKSAEKTTKDQKQHWLNVIQAAEQGTAKEDYPHEWLKYNGTIQKLYQPQLETLDVYTGLWYYGDAGTGKSRSARATYPDCYEKLPNKWWDNYEHQDVVLIDDLGMDHKHMGSFLKRYADHYPFRVEYKGGSTMIRPKTIVITSNYRIEEIWADDPQMIAALNRRFKIHHFENPLAKKWTI